jgi:hypothetical protein
MRPSFVVVGAIKSGTTSLYKYLIQHPGIFIPPFKLLNHFIEHPLKRSPFQGPDVTYKIAFRSREEYLRMYEDAPEGSVAGDVSHIYLYAPESPGLIHDTLDAPKIIAILRNPVDRAYAQYEFHRKLNIEPFASFEDALNAEEGRIRAKWDPTYHYVKRGLYGEQLERYYRLFPASSIRVYKFEDFFKNPTLSLADLYEFVGVDPSFVPDVSKKFIPGGDPRAPDIVAEKSEGVPDAKPMTQEIRNHLIATFTDDIHKTMRLTGLDLTDWLQ